MLPPIRTWSRDEMSRRIARFSALKGFDEGLQDSHLPECKKTTYNVIGFQTPEAAGDGAVNSPVGRLASMHSAIPISEGFNLGFVRCRPGKGVLAHNHDSNETFVVMSGRWRFEWNEGVDLDFIEAGYLDVVSIPAGCARRFENITADESDREHLLLFVIGGDAPQNEFTARSMARVAAFERLGR
ncbi:MAG: cupin domain-containing protein [Burkholderiales bacterium]